MASAESSNIPKILLLCMEPRYIEAFNAARAQHLLPPSISITTLDTALSMVPPETKFDTIVSPANSYGLLDGGFDDAITRAFTPQGEYYALTRVVQRRLYSEWHGFAPPGTCTMIRIPDEYEAKSRNVWGTRRIALCPTMRYPRDVRWDREVVYECVWSLLCSISNHNRAVREGRAPADDQEEIRTILMTPLATGYGKVSPERWAAQTVLAMRHFDEAADDPEKWSSLSWPGADSYCEEVDRTLSY